jgi:hypothetical protein
MGLQFQGKLFINVKLGAFNSIKKRILKCEMGWVNEQNKGQYTRRSSENKII